MYPKGGGTWLEVSVGVCFERTTCLPTGADRSGLCDCISTTNFQRATYCVSPFRAARCNSNFGYGVCRAFGFCADSHADIDPDAYPYIHSSSDVSSNRGAHLRPDCDFDAKP